MAAKCRGRDSVAVICSRCADKRTRTTITSAPIKVTPLASARYQSQATERISFDPLKAIVQNLTESRSLSLCYWRTLRFFIVSVTLTEPATDLKTFTSPHLNALQNLTMVLHSKMNYTASSMTHGGKLTLLFFGNKGIHYHGTWTALFVGFFKG